MIEILLVALLALVVYFYLKYRKLKAAFDLEVEKRVESIRKELEAKIEEARRECEARIEAARREAIEKSKAVVLGKVSEQLAPYLPGFKYNPKDVRFIGSPVDFIVFDGLDEGNPREVVFLEVKTGKSRLSERERAVKKLVEEKKVRWETITVE